MYTERSINRENLIEIEDGVFSLVDLVCKKITPDDVSKVISGELNNNAELSAQSPSIAKELGSRSIETKEIVERIENNLDIVRNCLREAGVPDENIAKIVDSLANIEIDSKKIGRLVKSQANLVKRITNEPPVDPNTGLSSGAGIVEANALSMVEIGKVTNPQERELLMSNHYFLMIDMMLFHRGVETLKDKFDDRIKNYFAKSLIGVASFLADDDSHLYSKMSQTEFDNNELLLKYFPVGSKERETLFELKRMGVKIWPARLHAGGGDEFEIDVDVNVSDSEHKNEIIVGVSERNRRIAMAMEVVSNVINKTLFSNERGMISEEIITTKFDEKTRRQIYQEFYNLFNKLVPGVDEEAGVTEEMSQFFRETELALRDYFRSKETENQFFRPDKGLMDCDVDLRMDYANVGNIFTYPTLLDFERYVEDNIMINDDDFIEKIKNNSAGICTEQDLSDPKRFRDMVAFSAYKELLYKYQQHLFGEVNGASKIEKKLQILKSGMAGDPQSIYTIGAIILSKRDMSAFDNYDKRSLWANVLLNWIGIYSMENYKKMNGDLDYNRNLVDGKFGAFLASMENRLSDIDPETGQTYWFSWMGTIPTRNNGKL